MLEKEELGHPARSLLRQLRQNLPLFSPAEQLIGEFVLARPRQVLRLPTDQLAKEIGVSQGTLSNFSQALGYNGIKAFRLDLAAEVNTPLHLNQTAIARGDTLQDIANKAISADIDALLTTLRSLDMGDVEKAIEAIQQARRIDLYAMGISSSVALDAFNRLLNLGLSASWLPDIANQLPVLFLTARCRRSRVGARRPYDHAPLLVRAFRRRPSFRTLASHRVRSTGGRAQFGWQPCVPATLGNRSGYRLLYSRV